MKGHIRQRGPKTWAIKLYLGRDPITGKKKDKWHTFHGSKRDSQAEAARLIHELKTGAYVEPSRLTVADYLEKWLVDHARHNVSAKTFERYTEIVRKHVTPALGNIPLPKLAPLDIQSYYGEALDHGRRDGKGGLSPRTIKHHHRVLSQALRQAVRWRMLVRNPCDAVDPPRPPHQEMSVLDQADAARLVKASEETAIHIPVLLAVTTGMRRGEILALRWRDADLDGAAVSVTQTLEQTASGLSFKAPKTARGRRKISLPSLAVDALRRHKIRQTEERLRMGATYRDHDLVYCGADGTPRNPGDFSKEFARLATKLGMAVRFHDLRHTHISHLLAEGVHPKVASERAGHASVAITLDVYSHVISGLQEDAANRIDAALRSHLG